MHGVIELTFAVTGTTHILPRILVDLTVINVLIPRESVVAAGGEHHSVVKSLVVLKGRLETTVVHHTGVGIGRILQTRYLRHLRLDEDVASFLIESFERGAEGVPKTQFKTHIVLGCGLPRDVLRRKLILGESADPLVEV